MQLYIYLYLYIYIYAVYNIFWGGVWRAKASRQSFIYTSEASDVGGFFYYATATFSQNAFGGHHSYCNPGTGCSQDFPWQDYVLFPSHSQVTGQY